MKKVAAVKALVQGVRAARSDDGVVGHNDVPGLKALAAKTPFPKLAERLVDRLERPVQVAPPSSRLNGTGYARQVVDFQPGPGAGFNAANRDVVLGRPEGRGDNQGSLHVLSLGNGGQITVELGRPVKEGVTVFGNSFGPNGDALRPEPAKVEVSPDGQQWFELKGEAGWKNVYANSENMIRPGSLAAGGDRFLFSQSDLPKGTEVRYVRITDLEASDYQAKGAGTSGFDLDAVYGW